VNSNLFSSDLGFSLTIVRPFLKIGSLKVLPRVGATYVSTKLPCSWSMARAYGGTFTNDIIFGGFLRHGEDIQTLWYALTSKSKLSYLWHRIPH